jgi:hypothetical protein
METPPASFLAVCIVDEGASELLRRLLRRDYEYGDCYRVSFTPEYWLRMPGCIYGKISLQ